MIAVVMGCDKIRKRAKEAENLLEYGFKNFATVEAVKQGASFGPVKVRRGKLNKVTVMAAEAGWVTVAKGKENLVSVTPELPKFVVAPIQKNQVIAKALIQNEGKVLKQVNLLSPLEIEKSILPPWPVLIAIILGIVFIGLISFWWIRTRRLKPKPLR
jgi:D-alanyl-D-alanine carboxypeptidase (penicillin-binding protein 5/6)